MMSVPVRVPLPFLSLPQRTKPIEIGTHYRSPFGRSGSPTAQRRVSAPPVRVAGHPPGSSGSASALPGLAAGEGKLR